jgi:antitoxin ParD1/3/4
MTTLNVSLPKALQGFVEHRTKAGGYESASEYLRELIREDQKRLRELERKLLAGLNSGEPIVVDEEFWARKKSALKAKFASKARKS